jgi:tetratricopeptide (TPR) repeat protein
MLKLMTAAGLAFAVGLALAPAAFADSSDPAPSPRLDCSKKANKDKPGCRNHYEGNDELYQAAYWAARNDDYAKAQGFLKAAPAQDDPRILNLMGYTTRKLGDVETALGYYGKALAANPDFTVAREYRGEAYLQKGDLVSAKAELTEIAARCGTACTEHAHLADHIARFEASQAALATGRVGG